MHEMYVVVHYFFEIHIIIHYWLTYTYFLMGDEP